MSALEPLRPTTARWLNRRRRVRDDRGEWGDKWAKVLAHTGHLTQFEYGTDTPTDWSGRGFQKCLIGAEHTRMAFPDVDDWDRFSVTPLGRALATRGLPISHRGPSHCHYALDMRAVPPGRWPGQASLYGDSDIGHLKSNGWIPVPGSVHWSEELYEPIRNARGRTDVIWADEELLGLLEHAVSFGGINGGGGSGHDSGGSGRGHDDEVSAACMGMILRRLRAGWRPGPELKEDVYREWTAVAIPHDPSYPFERGDFERHYGDGRQGGLEEALRIIADEAAWMPGAMAWAQAETRRAQALPRRPRKPGTRKPGARR